MNNDTAEPAQPNTSGKHEESSSSANGTANSSSLQTNIVVNGQTIDVPNNGQAHTNIASRDGTTSVDVSHSSSTSSSSNSQSSLDVRIHTQSSSEASMD